MADEFDPYYVWLGIPPSDQPANYYRLLGVELFEDNADVISNAADARMAHLKTLQGGKHRDDSQRLLNEISAARHCLLDANKRAAYDATLQARTAKPDALIAEPKPVPAAKPRPQMAQPLVQPLPTVGPTSRAASQRSSSRPWLLPAAVGGGALVLLAIVVLFVATRNKPPDIVQSNSGGVEVSGANTDKQTETGTQTETSDGATVQADDAASLGGATIPVAPTPEPPPSAVPASEPLPITPDPVDTDNPPVENPSDPTTTKPDPPVEIAQPDPVEPAQPNEPPLPQPLDPPTATEVVAKLPIPADDEQRRANKLIGEIFGSGFDPIMTADKRQELAGEFIASARQTNDDMAARYMLLMKAREFAEAAGAADLALEAADLLSTTFDVDALQLKGESLAGMSRLNLPSQRHADLANRILAFIDDALDDARVDVAEPLVVAATASASKARDTDLVRTVRIKTRKIQSALADYKAVAKALEKLDADPDDAEANLLVGRFYCLSRENWDTGLPYLAKGSDAVLAAAAKLDLTNPSDATAQEAVGDAWWDLAEKAESESDDQAALQLRSRYWYQNAAPRLTGLAKAKVDRRLEEMSGLVAKTSGVNAGSGGASNPKPQEPAVSAGDGMIGRIKVNGRDIGLLLRYEHGSTLTDTTVRAVLAKFGVPPGVRVELELFAVVVVPNGVVLESQHVGGSSSGGVLRMYIDGQEINAVGDDRSKSTTKHFPAMRPGTHAVRWVLTGGSLGSCRLQFYDRQTRKPLVLTFNNPQVMTQVNNLPVRARVDLSKPIDADAALNGS